LSPAREIYSPPNLWIGELSQEGASVIRIRLAGSR
jgi:hypothetical protein